MSVMQKLLEINDHLVRTLAECEQLRNDQKTLREISSVRLQRITELQDELRKACAERDEAKENAARLQAQLAEVKSQLEAVVQERYNLQTERNTLDKQLQELIMSQPDFGVERMPKKNKPESQLVKEILSAMDQEEADDAPTKPKKPKKPVKTPAGQNDLVRDVSHYIEAAEVDRPTEPQFKPYTFAAYIVGDKSQPDALRIVWGTEEWIQHAKFGIVHRISDLQFSGNDTFTPDQFSVTLKIQ